MGLLRSSMSAWMRILRYSHNCKRGTALRLVALAARCRPDPVLALVPVAVAVWKSYAVSKRSARIARRQRSSAATGRARRLHVVIGKLLAERVLVTVLISWRDFVFETRLSVQLERF